MNWQEKLDKIRFQAGCSRGFGMMSDFAVDQVAELSYQAGIKEVVEWVEKHNNSSPTAIPEFSRLISFWWRHWQDQKKEWGCE